MDIMWWLDSLGSLQRPLDPADQRRHEPSLQLIGQPAGHRVDLPALADRGVRLTGRLSDIAGTVIDLGDDLAVTTAAADRRLDRLLRRIDAHATARGLGREIGPRWRPRPSAGTTAAVSGGIDLRSEGIDTVVWAAGYRRSYPWLQVSGVVGPDGEIRHQAGLTSAPGVVAVGLAQQTRPNSTFIDGVRYDAEAVVEHLRRDVLQRTARRSA